MTRMTAVGSPRLGLIQFPGSNCDMDCTEGFQRHFGIEVRPIWHQERSLPPLDAVIIPGGFSYGDYLRSGALAAHSPIMSAVKAFVGRGGAALGICNGFQILTESHLLPGALLRNQNRRFICRYVHLAVGEGSSAYHRALGSSVARVPIAHGEGRYFADGETLRRLRDQGQIAFRYSDLNGHVTSESNPNGALDAIAGLVSENGRVLGMMPHPERALDELVGGSADGLNILQAFLASFL